jgi:adenosylcobinamide kinase / adenosylcobinamide-phosphate guanylyltransferase
MHPTTLIIGGCRSGKSRHALELGNAINTHRKLFVATCVPRDTEMHARVQRHQQERGSDWETVEVPMDLAEALHLQGPGMDLAVVDCLTLWVSNLLLAHETEPLAIDRQVSDLCALLSSPPCPLILVTNEVGAGIVPDNQLARRYRDLAGHTNQQVATACRRVIWMVAGIPVPIKTAV